MSTPRRAKLRTVAADLIVPGDLLWSSATDRPLRVLAAARTPVKANGNLYSEDELADGADVDDALAGDAPTTIAIVLSVQGPAGDIQRLGAYAPRARLQVLR